MSRGLLLCAMASAWLAPIAPTARAQDIFAPPIREIPTPTVQIDQLDLWASVDSTNRLVRITVDALIRAKEPGLLQFTWPTNGIGIDSVHLGTSDTTLTTVRADSLVISLSSALPSQTSTTLRLNYSLPLGARIQASTDPQIEEACCLWTAGDWVPVPDNPAERYKATLTVEVPAAWSVVAGGRLSRVHNTWAFKLPRPARPQDLGFAAGVFDVTSEGRVQLAVPRAAVGDPVRLAEQFKTPMDYLTRKTGYRLPWDTVRVALLPLGGGKTASSAGLILADVKWLTTTRGDLTSRLRVGASMFFRAKLAAMQWSHGILAPEWWSERWINESIAGVLALAYLEDGAGSDNAGSDAGVIARRTLLSDYLDEAGEYRRPLVWDRFFEPEDLRDQHAQAKGPLVLYRIKARIGDPAFWGSIRRLLARYAFRPLISDHLVEVFEPPARSWITEYFDSWVYAAGHPVIRFSAHFDSAAQAVVAAVEQLQEGALVPTAFPLTSRIDWLLLGETGSGTLSTTKRSGQFQAPASMSPRFVRMDPNGLLVHESVSTRGLSELAALLRYGTIFSRLDAAEGIAGHASDPLAMLSLRLAYFTETSPVVRAQILSSAGSLMPSDSGTSLLTAGLSDRNATVRLEAVYALSRQFPSGGADMLLEGVAQRDSIYQVQAAAVAGMSGGRAEALARAALITESEDAVILSAGVQVLVAAEAGGQAAFLEHTSLERPVPEILAALRLAPITASNRQTRLRILALLAHPAVSVRANATLAAGTLLRRGNRPAVDRIARGEWHSEVKLLLDRLSVSLASAPW